MTLLYETKNDRILYTYPLLIDLFNDKFKEIQYINDLRASTSTDRLKDNGSISKFYQGTWHRRELLIICGLTMKFG
jgi:hypothetical protein